MKTTSLYNEFGLSLVKNGSWIGFSHEIEFDTGTELRKYGWKIQNIGNFLGIYARIWIGKRVLVISQKGFQLQKKGKFAVKFIIGFEFKP